MECDGGIQRHNVGLVAFPLCMYVCVCMYVYVFVFVFCVCLYMIYVCTMYALKTVVVVVHDGGNTCVFVCVCSVVHNSHSSRKLELLKREEKNRERRGCGTIYNGN